MLTVGTPDDILNPSLASLPTMGNAQNNVIVGVANVLAGTGTTAVVIKCRRGSNTITGTQVGTSQSVTLAAGATDNVAFRFQDPGAPPLSGYSLTITQTGGTAAGTVNEIVASVEDYI